MPVTVSASPFFYDAFRILQAQQCVVLEGLLITPSVVGLERQRILSRLEKARALSTSTDAVIGAYLQAYKAGPR